MFADLFERITQWIGKASGIVVNRTIHLQETISDNVRTGYGQYRTKRCIWCKSELPMLELKVVSEKYLMCGWCLEGLAAPEAMMPEKYIPHANRIIDTMLARAAADKVPYPSGFNGFIMHANITIAELFPNNTQPNQEQQTLA
jgi:hypothetical protein